MASYQWPLGGPQPAGMTLAAAVAGALTSFDGARTRPSTWALLAVVCIVAALGDGLSGLAAGLLGAAVFVVVHVAAGTGGGSQAIVTALIALAFVVSGGLIGVLARSRRARLKQALSVPPATGVLSRDEGVAYLSGEWDRAEAYERPLSVLALRLDAVIPEEDPRTPRIRRACRRALLVALPAVAVPFDVAPHVVAVVAPEHDRFDADALARTLEEALLAALYTDPAGQVRQSVAELVVVASGVATRADGVRDADELVTRAQASLAAAVPHASVAR